MDQSIRAHLVGLRSGDHDAENAAFTFFVARAGEGELPADDVWEEMVENLTHKSNRVRAIASQVVCNLAASDPRQRILADFDKLLEVTKDERFVTARHCIQSIWKVGLGGDEARRMLMDGLAGRFAECVDEKNCTLIRYDLLQSMRHLYDAVGDENIAEHARALIETEEDLKYRKKYSTLWKAPRRLT